MVFLKNRRAGGRGQKHSLGGTCIGFEYWGAGLTAAEGDAAARRRAAAASSNTHMVELESNNGGTFVSSFWGCQNLKFKTYPCNIPPLLEAPAFFVKDHPFVPSYFPGLIPRANNLKQEVIIEKLARANRRRATERKNQPETPTKTEYSSGARS